MLENIDSQIAIVLQAAQRVIDKTEITAYRQIIREMAYQMTIGMSEDSAIDRMVLWGMDFPLIQEVMSEHVSRHEKDEMNSR